MKENCWKIKETRPIKVSVVKRDGWYDIRVPEMKMLYDTYEDLVMCHRSQDIGVTACTYKYSNGECEFTANTEKDVTLWIEKYKDIVTL